MTTYDYSFLDRSIENVRTMKGCDVEWLIRAAIEIGTPEQTARTPRIITPSDRYGDNSVFEIASYATRPGHGIARVQDMVGNRLPQDFLDFYQCFEKALVVTRTFPLYLWSEDKIIEGIKWHREFHDKPFRLFRFGDQYEREATQFGLWLETPGTMQWRVISTDIGTIDDMDDDYVEPDRIIGSCFYSWLKSWIERDGLPDGFMDLGPEGGYMDPV